MLQGSQDLATTQNWAWFPASQPQGGFMQATPMISRAPRPVKSSWPTVHIRSSACVRRNFGCPTRPCSRHHRSARAPRAYDHQSIHAQTVTNFHVSRAYGYQCIHAQTMISFVFREHTIYLCCIHTQTIITFVFREHTLYQCIHAQTIITFVFREHKVISASMPKP